MSTIQHQTCSLCGSPHLKETPLHTQNSIWAGMFSTLNTRVAAVTCIQCGYTEMRKRQTPRPAPALAFSVN